MAKKPASRARKAASAAASAAAQPAPPEQPAPAVPVPAPDPYAEITALRNECFRELNRMDAEIQQIVQVNMIENVLCQGFTEVREGLDRLQQSAGGRVPMLDEASLRLDNLRTQLKGPSWSGATTLPIIDCPVAFIGADNIAPPASGPPPPFCPDPSQPGPARPDYQPNRDQYGRPQS